MSTMNLFNNVNVRFLTVYALHETDCEGRQITGLKGYFSTRSRAEHVAKGDHFTRILEKRAIEINEASSWIRHIFLLETTVPIDLDGVKAASDEEIRRKAIEKLDPEERRVLKL